MNEKPLMQESKEMTAEEARKELLKGGRVFYHGTSSASAAVIFREGLVPKKGITVDRYLRRFGFGAPHTSFVALAPKPEFSVGYAKCAAALAGGHPIILKVKIPVSFDRKVTPHDPYEFRFEGTIPPEWLSIFSTPPALRQDGLRLAETTGCRVAVLEILLFPFMRDPECPNDGLDPERERRALGYLRALREQGIIKLSDSELELFFLAGAKFRRETLKASSSATSVDHEGLALRGDNIHEHN